MSLEGVGMLDGIRVVELGGIGPGPHAGMLLAGLGAEVIRVVRPDAPIDERYWDGTQRGRILVAADLKSVVDVEKVRMLADAADVVIEGFRPGVAERLGLGAKSLRTRNPALIYGRMTGWGQSGPWAMSAGHDINYLGLSGALHAIGGDRPTPPLNLVGDFGGGSTYLVIGVLAALVKRASTGSGCEIDAAIVDGASSLMQLIWSMQAHNRWLDQRGSNLLDGGAPFYRTYECADGGWMAVGALEPAFYAELLAGLGLDQAEVPDRDDRSLWASLEDVLAQAFLTRSRGEWEEVFAGTDACATPVLAMAEVAEHPHVAARGSVKRDADGVLACAAPRIDGEAPRYLDRSVGSTLDAVVRRWREVGPPSCEIQEIQSSNE